MGMRPIKPLMLAVLVISLFFLTQRVAATLIVSCPFGSPGGDDLSRGFYVTSYPGSNLYDVHVQYDASPSGTYTISMTAHLGAYNGPIIGSPQSVVVSLPSTTSEQDVIFHFGGASVPSGSTVAFTQTKVAGPGTVYYNTGSGTCSGVFQTNGTTPPLDTVRRNSVGLEISESSGGVSTDWAISYVSAFPFNPQIGNPVGFSAVLTALSSTGSYPQSVHVKCTIDGMSCGGGSVSYPGPTGAPATVSAQVPWIATPGIHTLTWSVSTNNDPNPSNNVMSITFAVGSVQTSQTSQISTLTQSASDFMIDVSPASQSVVQGQTASYSVNVAALNGFNSQVSLSVSGLPSDANGVFSNPSGTPNFASTLTVTLPENVSTGSYTLTVTGSGGGLSHVANLVLTVNAAMVTQTSISSTQTSSDLMSMIQQNQPLILGGIVLIVVLAVAVALMSRRKPTQTQPTSGATPGMIYCRSCGTQNPTANEFCIKCGTKLH